MLLDARESFKVLENTLVAIASERRVRFFENVLRAIAIEKTLVHQRVKEMQNFRECFGGDRWQTVR